MYEARKCAMLRFPVVLSIYATLCGIIVLAIERTIATLKYKTYEVKAFWLLIKNVKKRMYFIVWNSSEKFWTELN